MQVHVCHARVRHRAICRHWLCLLPVTPTRRDGHVLGSHWPAPQRSSQLQRMSCAKHDCTQMLFQQCFSAAISYNACLQPQATYQLSTVYVIAVTLHVVCLAWPIIAPGLHWQHVTIACGCNQSLTIARGDNFPGSA